MGPKPKPAPATPESGPELADEPGEYARELLEFIDNVATPEERAGLEELARRDREDGEPRDDA